MKNVTLGWIYPQQLNLYGDRGNIEIIKKRCEWRDISFEVINIDTDTKSADLRSVNIVFMGGGPDIEQRSVYKDFLVNKKDFLKNFYKEEGVGLFVCGAFQLLGKYYQLEDGTKIEGLDILNLYTVSPSVRDKRLVGNVLIDVSGTLPNISGPKRLSGFENHGGRTYLGETEKPLGKVIQGYGNNGEDETEGVKSKNFICSYLHGPILHKNFHLADYVISKAIGVKPSDLAKLDDDIEIRTHNQSANN